ncbi:hypothetical protein K7432_012409 [Basidiobolus ranarum]|uniref:Peptidase C51 domain-containing protein n=1 Tax=Basidiobolus ranarum TaxID=34480 RepID=A0ABR2VSA9_9FUNG
MYSTIHFCALAIILSSFLVQALPVPDGYSTDQIATKIKPRYYYSYENTWSSKWGDYNGDNTNHQPKKPTSRPKKPVSTSKTPSKGYNKSHTPKVSNNSGTGDIGKLVFRFHNGQCTDWADARYAQLTGHHIEWWGDARVWASKAQNTPGWSVSTKAMKPSIIVLQSGVQGAGSAGHVAVVENIESNGDVYTSNYNYNGGPYIKKFATFRPGNGVSFIWHN